MAFRGNGSGSGNFPRPLGIALGEVGRQSPHPPVPTCRPTAEALVVIARAFAFGYRTGCRF